MYKNIELTPFTCYLPTYYLDNKCDYCEFKPYAKCEANGYHTKNIKSYFEEQQELQDEIDQLEGEVKNNQKQKARKPKKTRKKIKLEEFF